MMIDSRYDEDLLENSFFQGMKTEIKDLIEQATREHWIICIPRADSFVRSSISEDDYLDHILVPNDELPQTHYRTLSGKQVTFFNKVITIEGDDLASSTCTHFLFEEIFYTEHLTKYKVWCIECPLTRNTFQYDCKNGSFNSVLTLRDCIDLLWTESLGKGTLEQLDLIIDDFLVKNDLLENCSLQIIKDVSCTLYAKCLQTTLQCTRLRERTSKSKHLLDNVKISVESYIQHKIYKKLFTSISVCTAVDDSSFNKIVRNLYDIQLRDLNIKQDFYNIIPCAKRELAKINGYSTVLGKLGCLRHTLSEISKSKSISVEDSLNVITADDLLPVFIFIVLKTSIPNWIANLVFLKQFQFSSNSRRDESNFLITTLEAAIEHIRSGILQGPVEPESEVFESEIDLNTKLNLSDDSNNNVTYLFEQIRVGNYDETKKILQRSKTETNIKYMKELCHPLCSCDKCERLLSQNSCNTTPTVHSCDDRGFTALHVACMYGKPKIVELLLEYKANIQSCDYSGASPLHYAAMRGHQNALLLLLHSGANINAVDSEKSTPLHFASNNGHETCVKAMLYFSEHRNSKIKVNFMNGLGNTPLHYASRWGYESIVQILLEYGADPNIENKHKKSPIDCAHNLNISHILINTKQCIKKESTEKQILNTQEPEITKSDLDFVEEEPESSSPVKEQQGIKPCSTKEMKMVELLLRAVAYGDVPLICYYLGLSPPENPKIFERYITNLCHPLCTCEKCESLNNHSNEKTNEPQDINICNSEGFTALHVACLHGKTQIVQLLINNGASVNIITRKGLSPLHLACQTQRNEIVKLLLKTKDCLVNLQDVRGNTPLHYACYANDQRITEQLMMCGANPNVKNATGKSALKEAEDKLMFSLVNILQGREKILNST